MCVKPNCGCVGRVLARNHSLWCHWAENDSLLASHYYTSLRSLECYKTIKSQSKMKTHDAHRVKDYLKHESIKMWLLGQTAITRIPPSPNPADASLRKALENQSDSRCMLKLVDGPLICPRRPRLGFPSWCSWRWAWWHCPGHRAGRRWSDRWWRSGRRNTETQPVRWTPGASTRKPTSCGVWDGRPVLRCERLWRRIWSLCKCSAAGGTPRSTGSAASPDGQLHRGSASDMWPCSDTQCYYRV